MTMLPDQKLFQIIKEYDTMAAARAGRKPHAQPCLADLFLLHDFDYMKTIDDGNKLCLVRSQNEMMRPVCDLECDFVHPERSVEMAGADHWPAWRARMSALVVAERMKDKAAETGDTVLRRHYEFTAAYMARAGNIAAQSQLEFQGDKLLLEQGCRRLGLENRADRHADNAKAIILDFFDILRGDPDLEIAPNGIELISAKGSVHLNQPIPSLGLVKQVMRQSEETECAIRRAALDCAARLYFGLPVHQHGKRVTHYLVDEKGHRHFHYNKGGAPYESAKMSYLMAIAGRLGVNTYTPLHEDIYLAHWQLEAQKDKQVRATPPAAPVDLDEVPALQHYYAAMKMDISQRSPQNDIRAIENMIGNFSPDVNPYVSISHDVLSGLQTVSGPAKTYALVPLKIANRILEQDKALGDDIRKYACELVYCLHKKEQEEPLWHFNSAAAYLTGLAVNGGEARASTETLYAAYTRLCGETYQTLLPV